MLFKDKMQTASTTILARLMSVILTTIFEMVWLPDNLTICMVVVNFESTLMEVSLMFWKQAMSQISKQKQLAL